MKSKMKKSKETPKKSIAVATSKDVCNEAVQTEVKGPSQKLLKLLKNPRRIAFIESRNKTLIVVYANKRIGNCQATMTEARKLLPHKLWMDTDRGYSINFAHVKRFSVNGKGLVVSFYGIDEVAFVTQSMNQIFRDFAEGRVRIKEIDEIKIKLTPTFRSGIFFSIILLPL